MAKPFLKWVGGKGALLPVYEPYLPKGKIPYYAEPFVGGGAVFFHLHDRITEMAILGDVNHHLMNAYRQVRDNLDPIVQVLAGWQGLYHDANESQRDEMYYSTRRRDRHEGWDWKTGYAAARFIFLNKTGYNGLWRVNRAGQCNTSHGKYKNPRICDGVALADAHDALFRVLLWHLDFRQTVGRILTMGRVWGTRFFVYLDPPYVPVDETSFTSYTAGGFDRMDNGQLIAALADLDNGGHRFMCSNSPPFEGMIEEWKGGVSYHNWDIKRVKARRNVNSNPDGRDEVTEILVRNYD